MKIYYQWQPWAYMHLASIEVAKNLSTTIEEIVWLNSFSACWDNIREDSVLVLAIENSYAGSIHENLYNFLRFDAKIIWEYSSEINHCLCSKEMDIKNIKKAYSHFKALPQCYEYLKKNNIEAIEYADTASAAMMVSKSDEKGIASISSELACEMYGLNLLDKWIQDQKWNTTRFIIVVPRDSEIEYQKSSNKVSILFEARDIPASLYKCLWAFATNGVNLTKIESMPTLKWPFTYYFWLDFEWNLCEENIKKSLEELEYFTNDIIILGEY